MPAVDEPVDPLLRGIGQARQPVRSVTEAGEQVTDPLFGKGTGRAVPVRESIPADHGDRLTDLAVPAGLVPPSLDHRPQPCGVELLKLSHREHPHSTPRSASQTSVIILAAALSTAS